MPFLFIMVLGVSLGEGFGQKPDDRRYLSMNWIGPRYFETLGTPWIAGRDFQFEDAARPRVEDPPGGIGANSIHFAG